ncbi:MAG: fatty acid desaturase [Candidatus Omnitrophica bacterium]|nr:fatty acid desaturase [Candidatus Omnitrophota bacterium]
MSNPQWRSDLLRYIKPDITICVKQILTSFIPYFVLMLVMVLMLKKGYSYWIVILFSPLAALFLVKIFIILHDCVHRSYLNKSSRACSTLGHICGILTFTAFFDFEQAHLVHHATVANLEKRGTGDIWTMTVKEYQNASRGKRILYRIFRNPVFLFGVAPALKFVLVNRFPKPISGKKELFSILFTDIMIALLIFVAFVTIGIKTYIAVQFPVIFIATGIGVWIFYIHHNFEGVYWAHNEDWDNFEAGMHGSVFYKLPAFLRWFTGSIGYHHIHHLNPGIPNYRLVQCHEGIPELWEKRAITLWQGFKSMRLTLWNEETHTLDGFSV